MIVLIIIVKAIFHCSRFARAGGATNFNHVKNQSRGHAKKVECSSTFMACPRAFRRTKNAQDRQLQRKLSNVRSARSGKATAMENCLYTFTLIHCVQSQIWKRQYHKNGGVRKDNYSRSQR